MITSDGYVGILCGYMHGDEEKEANVARQGRDASQSKTRRVSITRFFRSRPRARPRSPSSVSSKRMPSRRMMDGFPRVIIRIIRGWCHPMYALLRHGLSASSLQRRTIHRLRSSYNARMRNMSTHIPCFSILLASFIVLSKHTP